MFVIEDIHIKLKKMTLKKFCLITVIILFVFGFQSCSDDNVNGGAGIKLNLVDAPGEYSKVKIQIIDVQYNSSEDEEGWRSFESFTDPVTVDLLTLTNGESLSLADEIIEPGVLKQIRLVLGEENEVVFKDESGVDILPATHLDTPSSQQSGLKLNLNEVLEPGFSYAFILDFDVQKSVVEAGNSGKFILKPVIRVSSVATSGSIKGKVVEIVDGIEVGVEGAFVLFESDIESGSVSTAGEPDTGDFLIQGLNGTYNLKIESTDLYEEYDGSATDIVVNGNGDIQDAGTITLVRKPQ